MSTLVELCAGTAAVSLCAIAGEPVMLCGYMGAKRRWAPRIVAALGFDTYTRPDRIVIVDAGPWGDAWRVLSSASWRLHVQVVLRGYASEEPRDLWRRLVVQPPSENAAHRVAQFLWLQSRAAGNIPIWWDINRSEWRSPTGARHADSDRAAALLTKGVGESIGGRRGFGSGRRTADLLADRVRALGALPWDRITVIHGDVRTVTPIPGAAVYIDPPYVHAPRYAATLPRGDVLALVERHRAAGCRVVVSEAEPVGGASLQLEHPRGKAEWLSCWEAA